MKRVLDVMAVDPTLPLSLAIWGLVRLVVKLDSKGPALYRQDLSEDRKRRSH